MERYFKLSEGTTGRVEASYARPQIGISEMQYLEEPSFEPAIYDGTKWIEDAEKYAERKIDEIRGLVTSRWVDSSKTIAALKAQYDVFKGASSSWTSFAEVDSAYNDFIIFMDLI